MRTYLFLQGPHGSFFRELGLALQRAGHRVLRVNICGGDVVDWHSREAVWYQGRTTDWSGWIGDLMRREGVTDLLAFGDWRPLHREAILVAKLRNIRVWAFEEGYLRPHYITMEEGGVNGNSMLPHSPALLRELAESHPAPPVTRLPYRILFRHAYGRLLPIMRGPFFCARFSPVSGRIARRAP